MDRKTLGVISGGVVVVLGLIASALGVAGVTNMTAARVFLVVAWAIVIVTVVTAETLASHSLKVVIAWGAIAALVAGPILFGIDRWMFNKKNREEVVNQQRPVETPQEPVDVAAQIARPLHPSESGTEPLIRWIRTEKGRTALCSNPPQHATLNYWPLTFTAPAESCHDYPLVEARNVSRGSAHPQSKEDLLNGVAAQNGDEVYVLIYLNNGAANRDADPAQTLAKNILVITKTEISRGSMHNIDVTVSGDNIETIYGRTRINTNPDERLAIVPQSGQVFNHKGTVILTGGFEMGNNVLKIGDIRPNWHDSLFIRYRIKVAV